MSVDVLVLKDLIVAAMGAELEDHSDSYPHLDSEYRNFIREDFEVEDLDGSGRFIITSPWVFGGIVVSQEPVETDDKASIRNTHSIRQAAICLIATANDWRSPN